MLVLDFGSGLLQLVFSPNSVVLAATTQVLVQNSPQRWLGEWIVVESVQEKPWTRRGRSPCRS